MLRDRGDRQQPFFLAVGFWRPHLPFVAPQKYWDLYDPEAIPLPQPAAPPSGVPEIALHASREIKGYGLTPNDRPFREAEIRHYRHGYYASISFLDAQIGEILAALEANRLSDNTIVVFTSDHGFQIGEHGLWGKTSNFERDARVPLIIAAPDRSASHGQQTAALAELVDLFPTLADLAGFASDLPVDLEGVSLAPIVSDPHDRVQETAYSQHPHPFYGARRHWQAMGYSVRSPGWRYTEWRDLDSGKITARELYDHRAGFQETVNLADRDRHQAQLRRLQTQLAAGFPKLDQPRRAE